MPTLVMSLLRNHRRNGDIMRPTTFSAASISALLHKQKIATLPELMAALNTSTRRTVIRKLKELNYRTSYTHRGRYYTLDELAGFDEEGLWTHKNVWFSIHGTLLSTAAAMVNCADYGYFVEELDNLLHVGTKDVMRKLVCDGLLVREEIAGRFLYYAKDPTRQQQQRLGRRALLAEPGVVGPIPGTDIITDELRAAIVLFYSLLDEQHRRLYAGLEALKSGRGGDARIAELLGLNSGTVARGRRELLTQEIVIEHTRRAGAGRKPVEKKHQK